MTKRPDGLEAMSVPPVQPLAASSAELERGEVARYALSVEQTAARLKAVLWELTSGCDEWSTYPEGYEHAETVLASEPVRNLPDVTP